MVKNRRELLRQGLLGANPVPISSLPLNHAPPHSVAEPIPRFGACNGRLQRGSVKRTIFRPGCGDASGGADQSCFDLGIRDGLTMNGDQGKGTASTGADVKDSRRDRLKLALRENLKRRKSQARGRSEASASSESADASLDTASGEKPGQ
jgi:hypothetical protein